MNKDIQTVTDTSSELTQTDEDILMDETSDEELEAGGTPVGLYGSFGGWLSSTPQCCSFGGC